MVADQVEKRLEMLEANMGKITSNQESNAISIAVINTKVNIIAWVAGATFTAVIATVVAVVLHL